MAEPRDAEAIAAIYAPVVRDTFISFETMAPDAGEMRRRIEQTVQHWPWLVLETEGAIAGYAYAGRHRERAAYQWSVDVAVYVGAPFRRAGVGKALYTPLLALLTQQGYHNAYAGIALPNPGSVVLHEAVGFRQFAVYRQVGYKHGAWRDVGWWERELRPHEPEPMPPRAITELGMERG